MGKFTDLVKAAKQPKAESLNPVWGDCFPLLMEALYPAPGKATGTWLTPKYSVTVFSDGCALKAVVGSRTDTLKFFVTLDGPEAVLEQLELLIANHPEYWRETEKYDQD